MARRPNLDQHRLGGPWKYFNRFCSHIKIQNRRFFQRLPSLWYFHLPSQNRSHSVEIHRLAVTLLVIWWPLWILCWNNVPGSYFLLQREKRPKQMTQPSLSFKASPSTSGLHKLCSPTIWDWSTWSKFGAHGEHGDVFPFSNLGALWFSEKCAPVLGDIHCMFV